LEKELSLGAVTCKVGFVVLHVTSLLSVQVQESCYGSTWHILIQMELLIYAAAVLAFWLLKV
jgi:hypothetical protein